ncbi:MAG: phage tail protein [Synergistaceae bacterium]|nr:phage tail protein [Synergistaceae bacterium]
MGAPINIMFDTSALKRAGVTLSKAPEEIKIAVSHAVNRSLETFKSANIKETAQKYFVKQKDLRPSLTVKKSYGGELQGAVIARGERKPLPQYMISPKHSPVKNGSFRGAVKRLGGLKPIPLAFLMPSKKGLHAVIRDKLGENERLRVLMSPSIPQLTKNKETVAEATQKAEETFTKRLDHELKRVGLLP